MGHTAHTDIAAPAATVWTVLHDVERWPVWNPVMTWVRPVDDTGELVVGTRVRIRQPGLPVNVWTVHGLKPGRSFTWTTGGRLLTVHGDHIVDPVDDDHSRVTLQIRETGALAGAARPLFRRMNARNLEIEVAHLRRVCEERARR